MREIVRCNMRLAIGYVESNERDHECLYSGRSVQWGRTLDAEGIVRMPRIDADVLCLPRSAFHTANEGYPRMQPDIGLGWVEEIRETCKLFRLHEEHEATELMNQFLKDAYCWMIDRPAGAIPESPVSSLHNLRSLRWHLKLAEKHRLQEAKDYLNGLKGTVFGLVETDEGGTLRPAKRALVEIVDHDETYSARTDAEGCYEIKGAPSSSRCSPAFISAAHHGKTVESRYEGILDEPEAGQRVEKNLVVPGGEWKWSGTIHLFLNENFQCSKRDKKAEDVTREFFERRGSISFALKKVDIEASGASRIAADLPDLRLQGGVQARAYYNYIHKSPDSRRRDRMTGLGSASIRPADVQIAISRDFESMAKTLEALAVKAASGDAKALENMNRLLAGVPSGGVDIVAVVTIQKEADWSLKLHRVVEEKKREVRLGDNRKLF